MPIPLCALCGMNRVAAIASAATTAMNAIFIILDIVEVSPLAASAERSIAFLSVHPHYSQPRDSPVNKFTSRCIFLRGQVVRYSLSRELRNRSSQPDGADSHR